MVEKDMDMTIDENTNWACNIAAHLTGVRFRNIVGGRWRGIQEYIGLYR